MTTSPSELVIGVLLPDVLGTYSDSGNAVVLAHRAHSRGINTRILPILAADTPAAGCELYLLGGGEDTAQDYALQWLHRHRALRHALGDTAVTFAVCAGLQILGTTLTDLSGRRRDGLGLLDLTTTPGPSRTVGELVSMCDLPGIGLLTGFENHRGITTLGASTRPLGAVRSGVGNGRNHVDGAHTGRIIATYMHGPALARNPALADHLLAQATGRTFTDADIPDVPDLPALRRTYLADAHPATRRPRSRRWRRS